MSPVRTSTRVLATGLAAGLALAGAGCGGGGGGAADAAPIDAPTSACELPPGELHLFTSIGLAPYDDGVDLDGDGAIDNQLGTLPPSVLGGIRASFDGLIDAGNWLGGTYIDELAAPGIATDPSVGLHVVNLHDGDDPADPSNDQTGEGTFWVGSLFVDLDCRSTTRIEGALVDGAFTGTAPRFDFPLSTGTGSLDLIDIRFDVTYDPGHGHSSGRVHSYFTLCSLAGMPLPLNDLPAATSALDFLINDSSLAPSAMPDLDLDGDGLETIVGDGERVLHCVDGDGTIFPGRECPCRPEIADAVSNTMSFEAVAARALGIRDLSPD